MKPCYRCGEQITEDEKVIGGCTYCRPAEECPDCEGHGELHADCTGYPHITCREYECRSCGGTGQRQEDDANLCGLCGMQRVTPPLTACRSCAG